MQLQALAAAGNLGVPVEDWVATCVHMHCNRLLGTDRAREFAVMYHLERTLARFDHYLPPDLDL